MNKHLNTTTRPATGIKKHLRAAANAAGVAVLSLLALAGPAHAEAKPAPKEFCDGLDTATAWTTGIAAVLAVIGLVMIGITLFFQNQNGSFESGPWKKLGYWLGGAVLISGAASLASIFIQNSLNCAG